MKHFLISLMALLLVCSSAVTLGQPKKSKMPKGNLMYLECSATSNVPDPFYYFSLTNEADVINVIYWSTQVQRYAKVTMDVMILVKMRNIITRYRMFENAREYHNEGSLNSLVWHFKANFSKGGTIESTGYNYIPSEEAVEELKTLFKKQLEEPSTQFVSFVDEEGNALEDLDIEEYQNDPALRSSTERKPLPKLEVEEEELEELVP